MNHVTGTIQEKKKLLGRLTPKTFPYLVADILSYVFKHQNVRVVDGPGDGRRDIYSIFPDGKEGITQCKHHTSEKNVGSRETDEIVISLNKFGYYNGIFATTGGVSPQSKREYLDNYKNFNLDLWDADRIVNYTLSNQILRAYWLHGESIVNSTSEINIPFTLRSMSSDMPIIDEVKSNLIGSNGSLSFEVVSGDQTLFYPYRPPQSSNNYETGSLELTCWKAAFNGGIFQVEEFKNNILTSLQHLLSDSEPLQIRLGYVCILNGDEFNGATKILEYQPETYILSSGRLTKEKDYILPLQSDWLFPENLSMLEVPWACWLNKPLESILRINIKEDRQDKPTPFELSKHEWDQTNYDMSLYIGGEISKIKAFLNELDSELQPNDFVEFGYGGAILFWEHTNITEEFRSGLSYRIDKAGRMIPFNMSLEKNKSFNKFKDKLLKKAKKYQLKKSSFSEYESAVKLNRGKNIIEIPSQRSFGSADLFHYFEDCSSPVNISRQQLVICRFYSTNTPLSEINEKLEEISEFFIDKIEFSISAKISKEIGLPFILLEYVSRKSVEKSADDFLTNNLGEDLNNLNQIEKMIQRKLPDSEIGTVRFMRDSVGFKITEHEFSGNPWMIQNGKKLTWEEYEATL